MSNPATHPGLLQVLGDAQRIGALGSAPPCRNHYPRRSIC